MAQNGASVLSAVEYRYFEIGLAGKTTGNTKDQVYFWAVPRAARRLPKRESVLIAIEAAALFGLVLVVPPIKAGSTVSNPSRSP